jgi:hypothetical protein
MAKLTLKEFRCLEETDEIGSDSPYFLVFVGDATLGNAQSDVKRIRRGEWDDNVDTGELFQPNATVTDGFKLDFVLVAMMEEDWDPDIGGQTLTQVRNWMHAAFDGLASATGFVDSNIAGIVREEFEKVIKLKCSNDEYLGVKRLSLSAQNGLLPLLNFQGDGGRYRVRFALQ